MEDTNEITSNLDKNEAHELFGNILNKFSESVDTCLGGKTYTIGFMTNVLINVSANIILGSMESLFSKIEETEVEAKKRLMIDFVDKVNIILGGYLEDLFSNKGNTH